jgi:opacity protein-like surface antigen
VLRTQFSSGNTWLTGGQVGLGLDVALCTNWDLRGEWDYGFYNSSGSVGNPKSQQFNLGLIYKFEL